MAEINLSLNRPKYIASQYYIKVGSEKYEKNEMIFSNQCFGILTYLDMF